MKCSKAMAFFAIAWMLTACGDRPDPKPAGDHGQVSAQALADNSGRVTSKINGTVTQTDIVGTYEQELNASVKLIVFTDLRLDTNLTVPLDPASGSRLKPQLPHRLRFDATNNYYTTDTYFNLAGGSTKNAEFRVDAYDDGDKLDVTIIAMMPKSPISPFATNGTTTPCGQVVSKVESTSTPNSTTSQPSGSVALAMEGEESGSLNLCGNKHKYPLPQPPPPPGGSYPPPPDQKPGPGQQPPGQQPPGQQPPGQQPPDQNPPSPKPCPPCGSDKCGSCPPSTNTNTNTVTVNVSCGGSSTGNGEEEKRFLYHFIRK